MVLEIIGEQFAVHKHLRVSNDEQAETSSRDGNVKTSRVIEKTDGITRVGTDARVNDVILFSTLICVHCSDLHIAQLRLLKQVHQQDLLSSVGCDHADAIFLNLLLNKQPNEVERSHRFVHVDEGCSSVSNGLLSLDVPEEEGTQFVWIRKRGENETLFLGDSIQQPTVVVVLRGELGENGMHSVLVSKHMGHKAQCDETIHQRLRIPKATTATVENNGLQLALVANQNHALCSMNDRNHRFGLHRLRRLINQHGVEAKTSEKTISRRVASGHDDTGLTDDFAFYSGNDFEVFLPLLDANPLSFLHVHMKGHGYFAIISDIHDFLSAYTVFFFKPPSSQHVNAQVLHGRRLVLFAERHHTHHVDSCFVDTLTDFICCNVGWSAHEDVTRKLQLPFPAQHLVSVNGFVFDRNVVEQLIIALDEMIDESGSSTYNSPSSFTPTGLSCAGWSLDNGKPGSQCVYNGFLL